VNPWAPPCNCGTHGVRGLGDAVSVVGQPNMQVITPGNTGGKVQVVSADSSTAGASTAGQAPASALSTFLSTYKWWLLGGGAAVLAVWWFRRS